MSHKECLLKSVLGVQFYFPMCFGIRISSPFHLNTLMIPIKNLKGLKNAKNTRKGILAALQMAGGPPVGG